MKQINKKSIAMYITFIVLIVFLTGATCTIGECSVTFNDYTANAVNVKYSDSSEYWKGSDTLTLVGASVSIYPYDASTGTYSTIAYDTATVSSTGSFTFGSPEPNRYKLTGTYNLNSNWIFVPQYIDITNSGSSAKDLYAFPASGAGAYTIVASWETIDKDVDLSLTYGPDIDVTATPWTTGTTTAPVDARYHIYYKAKGSTSAVYHDNDVSSSAASTVPRVETMSIYSSDWFEPGDVIRFYLDVYNDPTTTSDDNLTLTGLEGSTAATSDTSSFAQVDLMNGSTHYGTWYIPWNTAERRLEVFYMEYYEVSGSGMIDIYSANYADTFKGIIMEDY